MKTDIEKLYRLRKRTYYNVSIKQCVEALNYAKDDFDQAMHYLEKYGGYSNVEKRSLHMEVLDRMPDGAPSEWAYILCKALLYLKLGPDVYRKRDYFRMPSVEWDQETLNEIQSCFTQFSNQKGYSESNPVENVSIRGFYAAIRTLHFEVDTQIARSTDDGKYFIDEMLFKHVLSDSTIALFNKVPRLFDNRLHRQTASG